MNEKNPRMVLEKEEPHFIVGMALKAEKAKKHISQKLIDYAAKHGIHIKVINEDLALDDQGHLDAICQKIRRRGMFYYDINKISIKRSRDAAVAFLFLLHIMLARLPQFYISLFLCNFSNFLQNGKRS